MNVNISIGFPSTLTNKYIRILAYHFLCVRSDDVDHNRLECWGINEDDTLSPETVVQHLNPKQLLALCAQ